VRALLKCWNAGECASIVGVGSAGKSNLIAFLTQRESTLPTGNGPELLIVNVDANLLAPLPRGANDADLMRTWAGFELILHRLFMALHPFEQLSERDAQGFFDAYQHLQDATNPLYASLAPRYFELAIRYLFRNGLRLVLLFDEFELLLAAMPSQFFQILRGLRDAHKGQLIYTTLSRAALPTLVARQPSHPLELEAFVELFHDNVIYLGPYSAADAQQMIRELTTRRGLSWSPEQSEQVLTLTGRFPGLLRACLGVIGRLEAEERAGLSDGALAQRVLGFPQVRNETESIWNSLAEAEQQVIRSAAHRAGVPITPDTAAAVHMLVHKQLIRPDWEQAVLEIQPMLFRLYVEQEAR